MKDFQFLLVINIFNSRQIEFKFSALVKRLNEKCCFKKVKLQKIIM